MRRCPSGCNLYGARLATAVQEKTIRMLRLHAEGVLAALQASCDSCDTVTAYLLLQGSCQPG